MSKTAKHILNGFSIFVIFLFLTWLLDNKKGEYAPENVILGTFSIQDILIGVFVVAFILVPRIMRDKK